MSPSPARFLLSPDALSPPIHGDREALVVTGRPGPHPAAATPAHGAGIGFLQPHPARPPAWGDGGTRTGLPGSPTRQGTEMGSWETAGVSQARRGQGQVWGDSPTPRARRACDSPPLEFGVSGRWGEEAAGAAAAPRQDAAKSQVAGETAPPGRGRDAARGRPHGQGEVTAATPVLPEGATHGTSPCIQREWSPLCVPVPSSPMCVGSTRMVTPAPSIHRCGAQ